VNNAGIAIFKPILNITYEEWSRVLAVNLTGLTRLIFTRAPWLVASSPRPDGETLAAISKSHGVSIAMISRL
jgi:NAD(P)-dependent dehydrogenase (short-subunit alcohol dehydrogenase family)